MNANMRNDIEQAALEVGRALAKYEMLVSGQKAVALPIGRPAKAADAPQAGKSPTIARGVKTAPRPRTKGVKEAVVALISSKAMSAADIIAETGFKAASVRATLMGLKKSNLAMNDDRLWIYTSHAETGGNSENQPEINPGF